MSTSRGDKPAAPDAGALIGAYGFVGVYEAVGPDGRADGARAIHRVREGGTTDREVRRRVALNLRADVERLREVWRRAPGAVVELKPLDGPEAGYVGPHPDRTLAASLTRGDRLDPARAHRRAKAIIACVARFREAAGRPHGALEPEALVHEGDGFRIAKPPAPDVDPEAAEAADARAVARMLYRLGSRRPLPSVFGPLSIRADHFGPMAPRAAAWASLTTRLVDRRLTLANAVREVESLRPPLVTARRALAAVAAPLLVVAAVFVYQFVTTSPTKSLLAITAPFELLEIEIAPDVRAADMLLPRDARPAFDEVMAFRRGDGAADAASGKAKRDELVRVDARQVEVWLALHDRYAGRDHPAVTWADVLPEVRDRLRGFANEATQAGDGAAGPIEAVHAVFEVNAGGSSPRRSSASREALREFYRGLVFAAAASYRLQLADAAGVGRDPEPGRAADRASGMLGGDPNEWSSSDWAQTALSLGDGPERRRLIDLFERWRRERVADVSLANRIQGFVEDPPERGDERETMAARVNDLLAGEASSDPFGGYADDLRRLAEAVRPMKPDDLDVELLTVHGVLGATPTEDLDGLFAHLLAGVDQSRSYVFTARARAELRGLGGDLEAVRRLADRAPAACPTPDFSVDAEMDSLVRAVAGLDPMQTTTFGSVARYAEVPHAESAWRTAERAAREDLEAIAELVDARWLGCIDATGDAAAGALAALGFDAAASADVEAERVWAVEQIARVPPGDSAARGEAYDRLDRLGLALTDLDRAAEHMTAVVTAAGAVDPGDGPPLGRRAGSGGLATLFGELGRTRDLLRAAAGAASWSDVEATWAAWSAPSPVRDLGPVVDGDVLVVATATGASLDAAAPPTLAELLRRVRTASAARGPDAPAALELALFDAAVSALGARSAELHRRAIALQYDAFRFMEDDRRERTGPDRDRAAGDDVLDRIMLREHAFLSALEDAGVRWASPAERQQIAERRCVEWAVGRLRPASSVGDPAAPGLDGLDADISKLREAARGADVPFSGPVLTAVDVVHEAVGMSRPGSVVGEAPIARLRTRIAGAIGGDARFDPWLRALDRGCREAAERAVDRAAAIEILRGRGAAGLGRPSPWRLNTALLEGLQPPFFAIQYEVAAGPVRTPDGGIDVPLTFVLFQPESGGDEFEAFYIQANELPIAALQALAEAPGGLGPLADRISPLRRGENWETAYPDDPLRGYAVRDGQAKLFDTWIEPNLPDVRQFLQLRFAPGAMDLQRFTPSWLHPLSRVKPVDAAPLAAALGFRLPTPAEWTIAAREAHADVAGENVADAVWQAQRAHAADQPPTLRIPAYLDSFAAEMMARLDFNGALDPLTMDTDGHLWPRPPEAIGPGQVRQAAGGPAAAAALLQDFGGNVAEFAFDPAEESGMFVMGASCMIGRHDGFDPFDARRIGPEPVDLQGEIDAFLEGRQGGPAVNTMNIDAAADLGLRLAFSAGDAARPPLDIEFRRRIAAALERRRLE